MSIELRFDIRRDEFHLNVDLELPARGVSAIFGPSGCGKTSLVRAIAGLDHHPEGYLRVMDEVWQQGRDFLPVHRRPIGYVFQEASLFPHLTVQQNIEYGVKRTKDPACALRMEQAIELLGVAPLLDRIPGAISGGERQRVAMARALAVNPKLLLMDEPLAALDQQRKREILPYLERLHYELEIPVIYVSHSQEEIVQLCDHLVLMEQGRVVASGGVEELFTRLDLTPAHDREGQSLITAEVVQHDETYALTELEFSGGSFWVERVPKPLGNQVRLGIQAKDVSIMLERHTGSSVLNLFPAMIDTISLEGRSHALLKLMVGETPLLARITRKSSDALCLQPGQAIYAQVKTVALHP